MNSNEYYLLLVPAALSLTSENIKLTIRCIFRTGGEAPVNLGVGILYRMVHSLNSSSHFQLQNRYSSYIINIGHLTYFPGPVRVYVVSKNLFEAVLVGCSSR